MLCSDEYKHRNNSADTGSDISVFLWSLCECAAGHISFVHMPRNLKGGIGSLFDPCVNAMGLRPF